MTGEVAGTIEGVLPEEAHDAQAQDQTQIPVEDTQLPDWLASQLDEGAAEDSTVVKAIGKMEHTDTSVGTGDRIYNLRHSDDRFCRWHWLRQQKNEKQHRFIIRQQTRGGWLISDKRSIRRKVDRDTRYRMRSYDERNMRKGYKAKKRWSADFSCCSLVAVLAELPCRGRYGPRIGYRGKAEGGRHRVMEEQFGR